MSSYKKYFCIKLPFLWDRIILECESCYNAKEFLGVGEPQAWLVKERNKMLQWNLLQKLSCKLDAQVMGHFTMYCKGAPLEMEHAACLTHHCTCGWGCKCKHKCKPRLLFNVPYSWKCILGFYETKAALSKSGYPRDLTPSSSIPGYTFKHQQHSGYSSTFLQSQVTDSATGIN